jgi:hypothetical protein
MGEHPGPSILVFAPKRGVYRRGFGRVNRLASDGRTASPIHLLSCAVIAVGACGCETAPRTGVDRYLVAVRYDVEPVLTEHGYERGMETVRRDLAAAAELGFNSVLFRHAGDGDLGTLLDSAAELGLNVALTPRACTYFVRTGAGGRGASAQVAREFSDSIAAHPAFAALVVDGGESDDTKRRGEWLAEAFERRGIPCVVGGPREGKGGLNTLRVPGGEGDGGRSSMEQILVQFHAGLAAGLTSGLVIDDRHALPGEPPGLFDSSVPLTAGKSAALRAVMTRAMRWGRRLFGAAARPVGSAWPNGEGTVTLTLLTQGNRRHALVVNTSREAFFRGDVSVPQPLDSVNFRRAVEVPASAAQLAGRVLDAREGKLPLAVDLRPGDAALFELF